MAEIGQELQRTFTIGVVQEIGNDDQEPALRITRDELARDLKKVGAPEGFRSWRKLTAG